MPKSIPLRQLDDVIGNVVEHIHDYTKSPSDFTRKRKLDPETLIKTTLNMQGNSLNAELYDAFPDIDKRMTASAYEQAKGKLSPQVFEDIFHQYNATLQEPKTLDLAQSYRVYAVDGSSFSVIMDRGYSGFNMFETFNRLDNAYYIIRTKAGDIKEIRELPDQECDVEMGFRITTSNHFYTQVHKSDPYLHLVNTMGKSHTKTYSKNTVYHRWDFEQFCTVKCRVVKFCINDPSSGKEQWEVLVTNLNRFEFPIERMKEMYHMRWDIETSFRELKYALGAISFHSKKPDFIRMELFAHCIMFNAVSRHISLLSVPQTNHKHEYAIDFKMACKAVRRHYRLYPDNPNGDVFAGMLSYINPVRPGRADKRRLRYKPAVWFLYRVA